MPIYSKKPAKITPKYRDNDYSLEATIWRAEQNIKKLEIKLQLANTETERRRINSQLRSQRMFLKLNKEDLARKHKTGSKRETPKKEKIEYASLRLDGIETPEKPIMVC